jgi:hypothetical protein
MTSTSKTPKPPTLVGTLSRSTGSNQPQLDITFSIWEERPQFGCFNYPVSQKTTFNNYCNSFTFLCDIWALYINTDNKSIQQVVDISNVNISYTQFALNQCWNNGMETFQWNAKDFQHHFSYASMMTHLAELGNLSASINMLNYMSHMRVTDPETINCLRDDISMFFESVDLKLSLAEFKLVPRAVMGKRLLKQLGKEIPTKDEDFPVCVICMDNITSRQHCSVLDCGHLYHIGCSKQWFTKHCEKPTCCCCRAEVKVTRIIDSHSETLSDPPSVVRRLNFDDDMPPLEDDDTDDDMPSLEDVDGFQWGNDNDLDGMPDLVDEDDIPDEYLMRMMDQIEDDLNRRSTTNQVTRPQTDQPFSFGQFTAQEIEELDREISNTIIRITQGLGILRDVPGFGNNVGDTAAVEQILSSHRNSIGNIDITLNITPRSSTRTHRMRLRNHGTTV